MTEPVMTWNLFLTAILVPVSVGALGLFAKGWINKAQDGWTRYEQEKEKNLTIWRTKIEEGLESVQTSVTDIKVGLEGKVTWPAHTILEETIVNHGERIIVLEESVKTLKQDHRENHKRSANG